MVIKIMMKKSCSCSYVLETSHAIVLQDDSILFYDDAHCKSSMHFEVGDGIVADITFLLFSQQDISLFFHVGKRSRVKVRLILLFPESLQLNLQAVACGNESEIDLVGLYALTSQQRLQIKTKQHHWGKHSQSNLILHGLLSGQARASYDGTIRIEHSGVETYAKQQNKNILLSSQAQVVSIPNIEVLQHNVQCFHGSAIGRFDDQQAWYMQSRGLEEQQIKKLLVQGLCAQILDGYEKKESIVHYICEAI